MVSTFISYLEQIWEFLFDIISQVFDLYTSNPIFMAVFTLYIVNRVFRIFHIVRG